MRVKEPNQRETEHWEKTGRPGTTASMTQAGESGDKGDRGQRDAEAHAGHAVPDTALSRFYQLKIPNDFFDL